MGKLQISRADELTNCYRNIRILINNKEVAKISNGETKTFEIESGNHIVEAKIDWCSSNAFKFNLSENECKTLGLGSFTNHNPFGFLSIFYYLVFKTDKYLKLSDMKSVTSGKLK